LNPYQSPNVDVPPTVATTRPVHRVLLRAYVLAVAFGWIFSVSIGILMALGKITKQTTWQITLALAVFAASVQILVLAALALRTRVRTYWYSISSVIIVSVAMFFEEPLAYSYMFHALNIASQSLISYSYFVTPASATYTKRLRRLAVVAVISLLFEIFIGDASLQVFIPSGSRPLIVGLVFLPSIALSVWTIKLCFSCFWSVSETDIFEGRASKMHLPNGDSREPNRDSEG